MYNSFVHDQNVAQLNESFTQGLKEEVYKQKLKERNNVLANGYYKRVDDIIQYRLCNPIEVSNFVFNEQYFRESNRIDYKMDTRKNLAHPMFKVLGFANEKERIKKAEDDNKMLLLDYDPKKDFVFRARDRARDIQPEMRFQALPRSANSSQARIPSPLNRTRIKPGDIVIRDKDRRVLSVNRQSSLPGCNSLDVSNISMQDQLDRSFQLAKGDKNTVLQPINQLKANSTRIPNTLSANIKERGCFKSLQQASLNVHSYYQDKAMKQYPDTIANIHKRPYTRGAHIDASELVGRTFNHRRNSVDMSRASAELLDDIDLEGEKAVARKFRMNMVDLQQDVSTALERKDLAMLALDRCRVTTQKNPKVRTIQKGEGNLSFTSNLRY